MTYKEELAQARALDTQLRADDARLSNCVLIRHADGSVLHLVCAFLLYLPSPEDKQFAVVLTEHHGHFVYPVDELSQIDAAAPYP